VGSDAQLKRFAAIVSPSEWLSQVKLQAQADFINGTKEL
jgi:hypothetical protein